MIYLKKKSDLVLNNNNSHIHSLKVNYADDMTPLYSFINIPEVKILRHNDIVSHSLRQTRLVYYCVFLSWGGLALYRITNSDYTNYGMLIQNIDQFVSTTLIFEDSYMLYTTICVALPPPNSPKHVYDFIQLVINFRQNFTRLDIASKLLS